MSKRTVFAVSKRTITASCIPRDLSSCIDEREVLKETPKGLRLSIGYKDYGHIFLHERYHFFDTRFKALLHLEAEAKSVLDEIASQESKLVKFLHAIEDEAMEAAQ